jgi:phosphohistidine phosphatase
MKILYFVRHGKAVPHSAEPDMQRVLSDVGKDEVKTMAKRFRHQRHVPEVILCSPAERARQTAQVFTKALGYDPQRIIIQNDLYEGDAAQIHALIRGLDDTYITVMLIGHNPALTQAAHILAQSFDSEIRTSSVLGVYFPCDTWQTISREGARVFFYDFPVRLAPKVSKHTAQTITNGLTEAMSTLIEPIDEQHFKAIQKTLAKGSYRLAKEVLQVLQTAQIDEIVPPQSPPLKNNDHNA